MPTSGPTWTSSQKKAAGIQIKVDEQSKNETIQAIAEVRKEMEELWDGGMTPARPRASYQPVKGRDTAPAEMYGQSIGYLSSDAGQKLIDAGTKYQAEIDQINADIVAAVEWGDKEHADQLAAQRDQLYAQWEAEVLLIKGAYSQSVSEIVEGMASQYPEAQKKIADAMEQYSALKALTEYDPTEMSESEMLEMAGKLLGMEGMQTALEKMGESPESILNMYGGLPVNFADELRQSLSDSLTASLSDTAGSPIYTVLQSLLSDAGAIESLDFTMIDGSLADGIALLDFRAAAEQAQSKGGEIGQYLTAGLGVGISGSVGTTNKDVLALRDAVVNQTRSAFDMGSPSRVMARGGRTNPCRPSPRHRQRCIQSQSGYGAHGARGGKCCETRIADRIPLAPHARRGRRDDPARRGRGHRRRNQAPAKVVQNAFRALVQPALSGAQGGVTTNSRTIHNSSTVSLAGANFYLNDKLGCPHAVGRIGRADRITARTGEGEQIMADWFDFAGVRSTTRGVYVQEYPPLTRCPRNARNSSPFRGGNLTLLEGDAVYDDIVLSVDCFVRDPVQAGPDQRMARARRAGAGQHARPLL